MEAVRGKMVYVYFNDPTDPKDLPWTVFLIFENE